MKFYRVQLGDTLEIIAAKYNLTISEIQKCNKNVEAITPGQTLMLPKQETSGNLPSSQPITRPKPYAIPVQTTAQPESSPTPTATSTPTPTATPIPTITPPGFTCPLLHEGSTGAPVTFLQQRLTALGFNPGPIDGIFGPQTIRALKDFQTVMRDLSVTGTTTLETWQALGVSCGLNIPTDFACPILSNGSRNQDVRLLQTRLKMLGFDAGAIDGIFGPLTLGALEKFQKAAGIAVTGTTTRETWQALGFICAPTPTATATPTPTPTATATPTPTVTPTPTATPPGFTCPLLRSGSRGNDVIFLQRKLLEASFNPGPIDGIFGPKTLAALQNFQRAKNIPVTGTTTLQTWLALNVSCALPTPPPQFNCPLLREGDRGINVEFLQRRLLAFGFDPGPIDGIFGSRTLSALQSFQRFYKELAVTGTTTIDTWQALGVSCATPTPTATATPSPTATATPTPTATVTPTPKPTPTPPPGFSCPILSFGSMGDDVEFLQLRLRALGYEPGPIDGIFGSRTESALKQFQFAKGITPTGTTTLDTWQKMEVTCATPTPTATATPTPTATPQPTPTPPPDFDCPLLSRGSFGTAVEFLQMKLRALGFAPGPIDGIFGTRTEDALKQFQASKRLTITGTTTVATWQAMDLTCAGTPTPTPTVAPPAPIESLWFYVDSTQAWSSLQEHYRLVNVLIPFWYQVTADAEIVDRSNAQVIAFAKEKNIPIYALVHNFVGGIFDANLIATIVSNAGLRTKLIANILELLTEQGLAGVNIDFEFIPPAQRANFTTFMQELYTTLHAAGYAVTVDVAAKTSDDATNPYRGAFDYSEIWKYADEVILLTQDEHYLGFDPGPIASIPWVESVVNYALSQGMPASKIKISIPVYGYDWQVNGTDRTVSASRALQLAETFDVEVDFDPIARVPHFNYTDLEGNLHEVWFENAISFAAKIDLVREMDLAGFAAWRIGLEDPAVWEVLDVYI